MTTKAGKPKALCRHCGQEFANRSRGLGFRCFYTPGVRDLYPVSDKPCGRRGKGGAKGPACWACNVPAPRPSHLADIGWAVRKTRVSGFRMVEAYCPTCFAEHGWPPEPRDYLSPEDFTDMAGFEGRAAPAVTRVVRGKLLNAGRVRRAVYGA